MQFDFAGENTSICSFLILRITCLVPSYHHPIQEVHQILKLVTQEILSHEKKNIVIIKHQIDILLAEHFEIVEEEKIAMTLEPRRPTHW